MRQFIFTKKVISSNNTVLSEDIFSCRDVQVIMSDTPLITINAGGFIVLDFGREECGRLHILTVDTLGGEIRIRLGESVAECYAELGENGAGNYHSLRDVKMPIISNADISTGQSGFRFARIDLISGNDVRIRNVFIEGERYAAENEGYFLTNDQEINHIYEVAKHTLSLCVQNGVVWDGIKRDRAVWIGDFHPELLSIASIYGNIDEIKRVLDVGEKNIAKGAWINYIPAYSAWWIICLNDYYRHFGERDYVEGKLFSVEGILKAFDQIILSDGSVDFTKSTLKYYTDNEFFLDWPTNYKKDSRYGWISLVFHAAKEAKKLFKEFNKDYALAQSIMDRLSLNSAVDSEYKQVEALQLLSGRRNPEDVKKSLTCGGASKMTGFMGYYILTAAVLSGGGESVLSIIKDFYGEMIKLGATSFWEDFDVAWLKDNPQGVDEIPNSYQKNIHRDYGQFCYKGLRHSLCHGWTAGVIAFFVRTVLGVKPIAPSFKKIQIKPNLLGLTDVEGKIPTPYGDIWVKHTLINGKIDSKIKLPEGIEVNNDEKDIY